MVENELQFLACRTVAILYRLQYVKTIVVSIRHINHWTLNHTRFAAYPYLISRDVALGSYLTAQTAANDAYLLSIALWKR